MKNKTLYQLDIIAQIDRDWEGRMWFSKLYTSSIACLKGCRTDELESIVDRLEELYEDESIKQITKNVKKWLSGDEEAYYRQEPVYGTYPLFWRVTEHQLEEK